MINLHLILTKEEDDTMLITALYHTLIMEIHLLRPMKIITRGSTFT
jgi:hypothetical protein